jgi:hypothetical protein
VPVEFLTDAQAAAYGSFTGSLSRAQLERYFFLDDEDRQLVDQRQRDHLRLGFAVQLGTVRYIGRFLADPVADVPPEVVDYAAEQLGIADPSCIAAYNRREANRREHAGEIQRHYRYRDFGEVADELEAWVDARAWTTGDGPKALFDAAVGWLRKKNVLLPGVSTLARLVARVRDQATQRLWDTLYSLLSDEQRRTLDRLLVVAEGKRTSDLDRLRHGPVRVSGPQMEWALDRAAELAGLGVGGVDVSGFPPRRLAELSRYGMDGKATLLRRHPDSRRLATLLATVVYLSAQAVDDALDLLDVLITTKLLARAERETAQDRLRKFPRLGKASATVARAAKIMIAAAEGGGSDADADAGGEATGEGTARAPVSLPELRQKIEEVVP